MKQPSRKKVITICSSASFYEEVLAIEAQLKKRGYKVYVPITAKIMKRNQDFAVEHYKTWYTNAADYKRKTQLMNLHFKKVMQADAVLVVNNEKRGIKGYIGGNGLMEMTLAYHYKKPLYLLRPIDPSLSFTEEILGMQPVIIHEDLTKINF